MLTLTHLITYILEGAAIAVIIYFLGRRKINWIEAVGLALTVSVSFIILDLFAPTIGLGARQGTGFGLGLQQVGYGNPQQNVQILEN